MKDNNETYIGIKVKLTPTCDMLEYFKQQADLAANNQNPDASAALAAYEYASLILIMKYNDNNDIMALIAAGNLLAIMGQSEVEYDDQVVNDAKNVVNKYALAEADENPADVAEYAIEAAIKAANTANFAQREAAVNADDAAKKAAGQEYEQFYNQTIGMNEDYLKQVFINSAGQIYQSVYNLIKNNQGTNQVDGELPRQNEQEVITNNDQADDIPVLS